MKYSVMIAGLSRHATVFPRASLLRIGFQGCAGSVRCGSLIKSMAPKPRARAKPFLALDSRWSVYGLSKNIRGCCRWYQRTRLFARRRRSFIRIGLPYIRDSTSRDRAERNSPRCRADVGFRENGEEVRRVMSRPARRAADCQVCPEPHWSGRGEFERPTLTLARLCSTPELRPRSKVGGAYRPPGGKIQ